MFPVTSTTPRGVVLNGYANVDAYAIGVNCVTAEFTRALTAFVFVVVILVCVHQFLNSEVVVWGQVIQQCCRSTILEHTDSHLIACVKCNN